MVQEPSAAEHHTTSTTDFVGNGPAPRTNRNAHKCDSAATMSTPTTVNLLPNTQDQNDDDVECRHTSKKRAVGRGGGERILVHRERCAPSRESQQPRRRRRCYKSCRWRVLSRRNFEYGISQLRTGDAVFVRPETAPSATTRLGWRGTFSRFDDDRRRYAWIDGGPPSENRWETGRSKTCDDDDDDDDDSTSRQPPQPPQQQIMHHRVKTKRLLPVLVSRTTGTPPPTDPADIHVWVVSTTAAFRRFAASQVTRRDRVLEIGCSTGEASVLLASRAASLVAFDTSPSMVETAANLLRRTLDPVSGVAAASDRPHEDEDEENADTSTQQQRQQPQPQPQTQQPQPKRSEQPKQRTWSCARVDALSDPSAASEAAVAFGEPTCVFADIGGSRELEGVVRMLDWILPENAKQPKQQQQQQQQQPPPSSAADGEEETAVPSWSSQPSVGCGSGGGGDRDDDPWTRRDIRNVVVKSERLFRALQVHCTDPNTGVCFETAAGDRAVDGGGDNRDGGPASPSSSSLWFQQQVVMANRRQFPRHPLQAPKKYRPRSGKRGGDEETGERRQRNGDPQPICRYYNYHIDGCSKGAGCPYDHEHCHWCLAKGHVARSCPTLK